MQKLAVGHDTAAKCSGSIGCGADHEVPFQVVAFPASSTATQKLTVAHEIESDGTLLSKDHDAPFHTRTSPSTSGATQKVGDAHVMLVRPSLGAGQRIRAPFDHDLPSQRNPSPPTLAAAQNVGEGHET